jgi:hypothetical protein
MKQCVFYVEHELLRGVYAKRMSYDKRTKQIV